MSKNKRKWTRNVLFCMLVFSIIGITILFCIDGYIKSVTKDKILLASNISNIDVDCILILGAGIRENGIPSHMLEDRLMQGIELFNLGVSDRLLMSGDHGKVDYDEVNAMKKFAIARGVPSENIFMDHAGFSTYESMWRARDVFKVKKVIIVTQGYHLYRAIYVAKNLGIEAYGIAADPRQYYGQERREMREIFARIKDFFYVIVKPLPTYLGEAVPVRGNGDLTND